MNLSFREITSDNWYECVNLTVNEDQKNFVAPNAYSLAQAAYDEECIVRGIYNADDMIGFIMYSVYEDEDDGKQKAWISRYMIDKNFQGKGYGKAALSMAIDLFEKTFKCEETGLSEVPENFGAKKLYGSLGFEFTGEVEEGEEIMIKKNTI